MTDTQYAVDPVCALSRGGVSDIMIVVTPLGGLHDIILAFDNEKTDNIYYFNVDPSLPGNGPATLSDSSGSVTFLAESDGTFSDVFGNLASLGLPLPLLGFISEPYAGLSGGVFPAPSSPRRASPWAW